MIARFATRDVELSRRVRRPLAVLSIAGYPLAVMALLWLPLAGVAAPAAAAIAALILVPTLVAMYRLYEFRGRLAQAEDARLDERQRQVRDRSYLASYRIFVLLVLICLVAVGIGPDIVDREFVLDYGTVNWFVMGAILISISLPSAVVAWVEPDLGGEI